VTVCVFERFYDLIKYDMRSKANPSGRLSSNVSIVTGQKGGVSRSFRQRSLFGVFRSRMTRAATCTRARLRVSSGRRARAIGVDPYIFPSVDYCAMNMKFLSSAT